MPNYNVRPIGLDLKPSYLLAMIFAGAALGACLILAYMPLALWIKLVLAAAALITGLYHILQDALLVMPRSVIRLELNSKGKFHLVRRNEEKMVAGILPSSFVMPYLTILNLSNGQLFSGRSVVITPDRVDQDSFRRLRVWLRWSRQAVSGDEALEEA